MSAELEPLLKGLHLANARRCWRELVQRAEREQWSYQTLLETLFSEEVAHRRGTRLSRAVRAAGFPFLRTVEEFDFTHQSTLRLTTIGSLLSPDFVTDGRSVIFEGKPGRGKTHLAIAVAYRALQNGFEALFTTAAELIDELSTASRDGRLRDALARFVRPHVLVVDEVGYLAYGADAANVLFHVVNDRHIKRRAMVFTTNKHPKRWGAVLHDDDLADAIVDRILDRGRLLRLDGPSVRTKHLPAEELRDDDDLVRDGDRFSGKKGTEFPERTGAASRGERWYPNHLDFEPIGRRRALRHSHAPGSAREPRKRPKRPAREPLRRFHGCKCPTRSLAAPRRAGALGFELEPVLTEHSLYLAILMSGRRGVVRRVPVERDNGRCGPSMLDIGIQRGAWDKPIAAMLLGPWEGAAPRELTRRASAERGAGVRDPLLAELAGELLADDVQYQPCKR